jgi:hypothetical protein
LTLHGPTRKQIRHPIPNLMDLLAKLSYIATAQILTGVADDLIDLLSNASLVGLPSARRVGACRSRALDPAH